LARPKQGGMLGWLKGGGSPEDDWCPYSLSGAFAREKDPSGVTKKKGGGGGKENHRRGSLGDYWRGGDQLGRRDRVAGDRVSLDNVRTGGEGGAAGGGGSCTQMNTGGKKRPRTNHMKKGKGPQGGGGLQKGRERHKNSWQTSGKGFRRKKKRHEKQLGGDLRKKHKRAKNSSDIKPNLGRGGKKKRGEERRPR